MREFNFKEFHNNLQKDLLDASNLISNIEKHVWAHMHYIGDEFDDRSPESIYYEEENTFNKERLVETLETIKLKIDFAYEYLSLTKMSNKLNSELEVYNGKFGELKYLSFVDIFYSPVKWILVKHLNTLTSHIKIDNESEYENTNSILLLEQILRGTPKMLFDRAINPINEKEVRDEVYKTLIHVFPDTVREIPIAKVSGTYKPDIGIKRLKCAIEYKFVNSQKETKIAIGGIFEDINGYEGSADWTTFYAVIYMTDNFITQDQVEAEFKLSKAPHSWKPIVVFGKGNRKTKIK
jgi:hypothetical protein